jgi:hypothetical protein
MVAKKKPFKRSTPLPAKEAREAWLLRATNAMRRYFSKHSYTIPENVRLSCGWPSSGGLARRKRRIGEAWASTASKVCIPLKLNGDSDDVERGSGRSAWWLRL